MSALRPLREHQSRAFAGLRQSLLSGHKRPLLQMPTGSGKTLTARISSPVRSARAIAWRSSCRAKTLIDQTVREFEREGISAIGVMQAAHLRTDGRQPIQICSAQTLARRKFPEADLVIVDEAHEMHASVLRWMADIPGVPFIGLSATPWARGLGKHYDDSVHSDDDAGAYRQGSPVRSWLTRRPTLICRASAPSRANISKRGWPTSWTRSRSRRHRRDVA